MCTPTRSRFVFTSSLERQSLICLGAFLALYSFFNSLGVFLASLSVYLSRGRTDQWQYLYVVLKKLLYTSLTESGSLSAVNYLFLRDTSLPILSFQNLPAI